MFNRILLVEDSLELGELLVEVLERSSRVKVAWFVRARRSGSELLLMNADGLEEVFDKADYDLAFVDWQLKMSSLAGIDVCRELAGRGTTVVAASGDSSLNNQMVAAGAKIGIAKDKIFSRGLAEPDFVETLLSSLNRLQENK